MKSGDSRNRKILSYIFVFVSIAALLLYTGILSGIDDNVVVLADDIQDTIKAENTIDYVRVGLVFSPDVVSEYSFSVGIGLNYGIQNYESHEFISIGQVAGESFTVERDSGNIYLNLSGEYDETAISGVLSDRSLGLIPFCSGEGSDKSMHVGPFANAVEAETCADIFEQAVDGLACSLYTSGNDELLLRSSEGNVVACYQQGDDNFAFAVNPIQGNDGNTELITSSAGLIYGGTFEFRIYKYSSIDGISVINIMPMEEYVGCVMSYEISNSYADEVQKTFAIVVRNYTYSSQTRHKSMKFSICCNTHCQAYRGCDRVNDRVKNAVKETEGLIISYGGKYAKTYYSASAGGCTIAVHETWQSSVYPYLKALPAPWETYKSRSVTNWTVEFTPSELYARVKGSCPNLDGDIASISTTYCTDSTHIYSVTLTDIYGNSDTISMSTQVRNLFGFNSGNFIVGKAGETVSQRVYSLDNFESIYSPDFAGITMPVDLTGKLYVRTENGFIPLDSGEDYTYVLSSGEGILQFDKDKIVVVDSEEENIITDGRLPDILHGNPVMKEYDVTLEGGEGNFVFVGKGWGHGAGLSQYGLVDLVNLGYDCKTILQYYFNGTTVIGANQMS